MVSLVTAQPCLPDCISTVLLPEPRCAACTNLLRATVALQYVAARQAVLPRKLAHKQASVAKTTLAHMLVTGWNRAQAVAWLGQLGELRYHQASQSFADGPLVLVFVGVD